MARKSMIKEEIEAEVVIVGGGLVGLTLAAALASAGVETVVIDNEDPAKQRDTAYDGRSSAIALGSQQILAALGLWPAIAPHAEPISDIRVSDGRVGEPASPLFLHFDHRDLGDLGDLGVLARTGTQAPRADRSNGPDAPLGYIVENRAIRMASHDYTMALDRVSLLAPMKVTTLSREKPGVTAFLADGSSVKARLAIAADGRRSPLRQAAGIKTTAWDYPQSGIVCTVGHRLPHEGVAHECFLPSGPFALLPMTDGRDEQGAVVHRSSLVWTERRALVPAMMDLPADDFARELERRFGDSLGALRLLTGRWAYPLSLMHAERYVDQRLALVGDAAHGIHPISGQGLNLGLRDVAALAEAVVDARRLGLDIGSASVLARYQAWRRLDNMLVMAVTDGLNRLFSNDITPLRLARDLGIAAVNQVPPVKNFFMRHAMGLVGDLPRLIRGQAL